jgi:hypothetical protein
MTGELTKAHNQFLRDVGTIHKEASAQYGKFADLAGVLSAVNPALSNNGLSIYQTFAFTEDGKHVLHTTLAHVSGESIQSSALFPPTHNKNPLHGFGANCTYMRRYTLLAILGICAGIEDDDGNLATPPSLNSQPVTSTHTQPKHETIPEKPERPAPADRAERDRVVNHIKVLHTSNRNGFDTLKADYYKHFDVGPSIGFSDHIQQQDHLDYIADWFVKNAALVKP